LDSIEVVHPWWRGKYRPVYPGKTGVIGPELVRARVMHYLRVALPQAAQWIREELQEFGDENALLELIGAQGASLEKVLACAHIPPTEDLGRQAQEALEFLAGLGIIRAAKGNQGPKK